MKPYWSDDRVTLYHGDAREVLPQLHAEGLVVDLLLTDPPYGISANDGSGAKGKRRGPKSDRVRDYFETDRDLVEARTLAYAVCHLTHDLLDPLASAYWWLGHGLIGTVDDYYRGKGFETRLGVWVKPNAPPPMPGCFPGGIEAFIHAYREGRTWNKTGWCRATINANQEARTSKLDHPTRKPLRALEPMLSASCPAGWLVLDPFCGESSTLVACRAMGLRSIGIELNERWAERSALRLSQGILPDGQEDPAEIYGRSMPW